MNGFRPLHRNDFILIHLGILSVQAFILFEFYVSVSCFDHKKDEFGTFLVDFGSYAEFFNVSYNTVKNWHTEIYKAGIIEKVGLNTFELTNADRYVAEGLMMGKAGDFARQEKQQSIATILQSIGVKKQIIETHLQTIATKSNNLLEKSKCKSALSFKVGCGLAEGEGGREVSNKTSNRRTGSHRGHVLGSSESRDGLPSEEDQLLINESIEEATYIKEVKEILF